MLFFLRDCEVYLFIFWCYLDKVFCGWNDGNLFIEKLLVFNVC